MVGQKEPSLDELRSAIDLAPNLVDGLVTIFSNYQLLTQRLTEVMNDEAGLTGNDQASEQRVHEFIHVQGNYFDEIEAAAESLRQKLNFDNNFALSILAGHLRTSQGIEVKIVGHETIHPSVRIFDSNSLTLSLAGSLDHENKIFQIVHFIALTEFGSVLNQQFKGVRFEGHQDKTRAQMRLCDYFAAALLMPYDQILKAARQWHYDFERLASHFSVTFEQVCQRVTTLNRKGQQGIPFFFLRIDKAGNVSKRFNGASIQLAKHGGACPKLSAHDTFGTPGQILIQQVAMPNGDEFLTINRTVDRPSNKFGHQDLRQAVCVGCDVRFADQLVYRQAMMGGGGNGYWAKL